MATPVARYLLRRIDPSGVEEVIPLRERLVIGRESADVHLGADRYASARHAEVEVVGDQVVVRDLGSRNGTYIRVERPMELRHGDVLAIGRQLLRFLQ